MKENKCSIVAEMIRRDIAGGIYQPGEKVPSEHQLAHRTGYSRTTVRRAVLELEQEGLVQRRQGSGTYICDSRAGSEGTRRIGVMVTSLQGECGQTMLRGMKNVFDESGDEIICAESCGLRREETKILQDFLNIGVDGILAEGVKAVLPSDNVKLYEEIQVRGIPVVFVNSVYQEIRKPVCVAMDDQKAGYDLGKQLIQAGHRRIAVFLRWDEPQGMRCYSGLSEAFSEAGKPLEEDKLVWYTSQSRKWLLQNRLESLLQECTAVVCDDEGTAAQVMQYDAGLTCVSFARNKNSCAARTGAFLLKRPSFDLGRIAAEKLLNIFRGKLERSTLLEWNYSALCDEKRDTYASDVGSRVGNPEIPGNKQ